MRRQLVPVGYLGFGEESYRERADHARCAGAQLLLVPRTTGNLKRIRKGEPLQARYWTGTHMEAMTVTAPSVWYDRTNPWPETSLTERFVAALTRRGARFVNGRRLRKFAADKWRQYSYLAPHGILMPKTGVFSLEGCGEFLQPNATVFIKKRDGGQGKETLIITCSSDGAEFIVRDIGAREHDVIRMHEFNDTASLFAFLASIDLSHYIIQQGVDVDTIEEDAGRRVYDFRVIFQCGGDGTPRMTLAYIRVGAPNSRQANIHQQGHAQDIESVFAEDTARSLYRRLRKAGKQVFACIQQRYQAGELGLDFVLDTHGKLWLLEVNARPGSSGVNQLREWVPQPHDYVRKGWLMFENDEFTNARRETWGRRYIQYKRNPYRYAIYLARQ